MIGSRFLVIPAEVVRETIASDKDFAAAVGLELAIRYRDVLKELKNQRIRSATERLANWLLVEAAVAGTDEFELEVSRALLAARLGMTGEHLSRAFTHLRESGVSIAGNMVKIDRSKLEVIARPSVLMDGTDI
jgi:CRP/FNR family transcriptional activator FtrB